MKTVVCKFGSLNLERAKLLMSVGGERFSLVVVFFLLFSVVFMLSCRAVDDQEVIGKGEIVVTAILDYERKNGRIPDSTEEFYALLPPNSKPDGYKSGWKYSPVIGSSNGDFELAIGADEKFKPSVWFVRSRNEWSVDSK